MPEPVEATAILSQFCSGLSLADLPAEVLDRVRWLLLDSIGCAFGGTVSEFGAVAQGLVDLVGGGAEATVLGSGQQTSAPGAAAANARLAGALDGDETFPSAGQTSHHAVSTVFAALALCERSAASGAELVSSIAAGYELGARFGIAVGASRPQPGRESTTWRVGGGPAGVLAATTASARALGLDATATEHALGIGGAHIDVPPLKWLSARPAPMTKSMDCGWHAMAGVTAAYLASLGMTGYRGLLDGADGLWRAMGYAEFDFAALQAGLGRRWYTLDGSFKRWPCQHWMHQPLTALARALARHQLDSNEIQKVVLYTNSRSLAPRFQDQDPEGAVTCSFNFPHAATMIALGVPPGPRWFSEWALSDPAVVALRHRVEVRPDPRSQDLGPLDDGGLIKRLPAAAEVAARGTSFREETESGYGNPWFEDSRLGPDDLKNKFRDFAHPLGIADPTWKERVERIIEAVLSIEEVDDVRVLTRLLAFPRPPGGVS